MQSTEASFLVARSRAEEGTAWISGKEGGGSNTMCTVINDNHVLEMTASAHILLNTVRTRTIHGSTHN